MRDNIKLFFSVYFKTLNDLLGGFSFLTDLAEIMAYITVFICTAIVVGSALFVCFGLFVVLVG